MDEKSIWIIPFSGKKEKWHMWPGRFMEGAGIKGYHIFLTGGSENPSDNAYKTKDN